MGGGGGGGGGAAGGGGAGGGSRGGGAGGGEHRTLLYIYNQHLMLITDNKSTLYSKQKSRTLYRLINVGQF